ncbi:hypothetical protein NE237_023538 [Protea cynaroides]|uniref:Uncharacterized protein n=1 Tax=Protea cynaroides TaxID=273540 RepID=A0A9Q0HD31_9MAGN|nr:hypothetical protein NE237_023538 [Protea cynaroides]
MIIYFLYNRSKYTNITSMVGYHALLNRRSFNLLVIVLFLLTAIVATVTASLLRVILFSVTGFQEKASEAPSSDCGLISKFLSWGYIELCFACLCMLSFLFHVDWFFWFVRENEMNSRVLFAEGTV